MELWVTQETLTAHMRSDGLDSALLAHYMLAAQESVVLATARSEAELVDIGGGDIPVGLKQAALMLAAHWYNQRESVAGVQMHAVPDALQSLVKPFRRLGE